MVSPEQPDSPYAEDRSGSPYAEDRKVAKAEAKARQAEQDLTDDVMSYLGLDGIVDWTKYLDPSFLRKCIAKHGREAWTKRHLEVLRGKQE